MRWERDTRRPLYGLRWLTECTQERLTHPLPVTKACLSRDDLDRVASRLHHQSSGFNAKPLGCLGGRLTRFLAKHAAELARTERAPISRSAENCD